MKTKYIILTISVLFSICKSVEAQNNLGDMFAGFDATTRQEFSKSSDKSNEASSKLKEAFRWYWLRQGDIQMWMNAHFEENPIDGPGLNFYESPSDASIYGEFDWDNKALMMHLKDSGGQSGLSLGAMPIAGRIEEANKHKQYTDKDGYWYVPYDDPNGVHEYIKFNAKQMAIDGLEGMIDILTSDLLELIVGMANLIDFERIETGDLDNNYIEQHIIQLMKNENNWNLAEKKGEERLVEKVKKLEGTLKELSDKEKAEMVGFPVFIHWALMYSPDYITARETVDLKKYDCNGIRNGCTKLTVTSSGENKGKYMEFDPYDRLTYINSLKEGTVRFAYGKDLTVNLPRAVTLSSMITSVGADNIEREKDREKEKNMWDNYAKLKEKKRKEEIENLREQEITELEKQLNEATTPQEREAAQEKIKELEVLREKEREKEEENNN